MTKPTHTDLVKRAGRWLTSTRKCALVMTEASCWAVYEYPDAIGWTVAGHSILVECKMSRGDFKADAHKPSKRMGPTMGRERWYMTPPGLLTPADMPDGYGLLEVHETTVRRKCAASTTARPGCERAEMPLLIVAARRAAWKEGWKGRRVQITCAESEEVYEETS